MLAFAFHVSRKNIHSFDKFNPIKGDVSDSELNAGGGQFDTTSEMNEGVP